MFFNIIYLIISSVKFPHRPRFYVIVKTIACKLRGFFSVRMSLLFRSLLNYKQNIAYKGIDFMPFSKPKFLVESLIE